LETRAPAGKKRQSDPGTAEASDDGKTPAQAQGKIDGRTLAPRQQPQRQAWQSRHPGSSG
jgi:hypothetical protein